MATPFERTTRALALDHARRAWLGWAVAGVGLIAWSLWFVRADITLYEVSPRARVEVTHAAHPIAASVSARIEMSRIRLGERVAAGDVLVALDASRERLALGEARAQLAALPAQQASLRDEMAAQERAVAQDTRAVSSGDEAASAQRREAEAAARFAGEQLARLAELARGHRVPELEVLRARAELDKSNALVSALAAGGRRDSADAEGRVQARRAALEALRRRAAELDGQRESLGAAVLRLEAEIDRHLVRAPIAGVIGDAARLEVGAFAAEGAVFGQVVPDGDMRIVADFPPAAVLGRIAPGQDATLRLDGLPWAQYGTVTARVARVASEIRDGLVRVELTPERDARSAALLRHGLPGAIEIAIERTTPALLTLRVAGQWLARPVVGA